MAFMLMKNGKHAGE